MNDVAVHQDHSGCQLALSNRYDEKMPFCMQKGMRQSNQLTDVSFINMTESAEGRPRLVADLFPMTRLTSACQPRT